MYVYLITIYGIEYNWTYVIYIFESNFLHFLSNIGENNTCFKANKMLLTGNIWSLIVNAIHKLMDVHIKIVWNNTISLSAFMQVSPSVMHCM